MSQNKLVIEEMNNADKTSASVKETQSHNYVTFYAILAYSRARSAEKIRKILDKYGLRIAPGFYAMADPESMSAAITEVKKEISDPKTQRLLIPMSLSMPANKFIELLIDSAYHVLQEPISNEKALRHIQNLTKLMAVAAQQTSNREMMELSNLFAQLIYVAAASLSKPKIVKQVKKLVATLQRRKILAV